MHFEYWDFDFTLHLNQQNILSGYLNDSTKEQLQLDKKCQKYLKKIVKSTQFTNNNHFEEYNISSLNIISQYEINLLKRSSVPSANIREKSDSNFWHTTINDVILNLESLKNKEKIIIEKECKETFKTLQMKPTFTHTLTELTPSNHNILEKFKFQAHLICQKTSQKIGIIKFQPFITKLDQDVDNILEEKLAKCVSFVPNFESKEKFQSCKNNIIKKYYIDLLSYKPNTRNLVCENKKIIKWNYNDFPHILKHDIFKIMEMKLFDSSFHELEFYKLSFRDLIKKLNVKERRRTVFNHKKKVVWGLEKEQLKEMNWNPFSSLINISIDDFINRDSISEEDYLIPRKIKQFKLLSYSNLDLIDSNTRIFGSMRFCLGESTINQTVCEDYSSKNTEEIDAIEESPSLFTKDIIDSSMVAEKRSFIDLELMSIIENKRKRPKKISDTSKNSSKDFQKRQKSLLHTGLYTNLDVSRPIIPIDEKSKTENEILSIMAPQPQSNVENKIIILNSNKIMQNHKILHMIIQFGRINVIEKYLDFPCDFVISYSTCIFRIKIDKFQQKSSEGKLFYQDELRVLMHNFKKIIVLVEYNNVVLETDPDLFWKIQLFLSSSIFEVHFISQTNSGKPNYTHLTRWITSYSYKYPETVMNINSLENDSDEINILINLGFNPLLIGTLLDRYPLIEILHLVKTTDLSLTRLLTDEQLQLISDLIISNW